MRTFVVTPPAPVVTWEDADAHIGLDGDETDRTLIESQIAIATANIDGPDGWLGRALGVQTLEARLDNFDCGSIRLPFPPTISIVSVKYVDPAGVVQEVPPEQYELLGSSLVPAFGAAWPAHRWQREAIRIRYKAGYAPTGDNEPRSTLPPAIRGAILLMVGDLYANRETVVPSANAAKIPMSTTVENLLSPLQVYR